MHHICRTRLVLCFMPGLLTLVHAVADDKPLSSPARISPAQLDRLISEQLPHFSAMPLADEHFLRRASLDLIGRQPTAAEQQEFFSQTSPTKRADLIERLLARDEFGKNWANYWSDTIAYRVPPPELTYLNYGPLKSWLANQLNANVSWDQIVRELITAQGKIEDQPAATFIGYHQAEPTNLAGETSRIFLGQQIGCAQCHDHPFDHWTRIQFHQLAAFFARTKAKLSQNDGLATNVSSNEKANYVMSNMVDPSQEGRAVEPAFLDGRGIDGEQKDAQRRVLLASFITSRENPWFAKAFTNRIWARLMGQGFFEPVDDVGDSRQPFLPAVHEALAGHFIATGCDIKDLFRLVMTTPAYERGGLVGVERPQVAGAIVAIQTPRLRGDEVFEALKVGLDLPNVTPPKVDPTAAIRFPPPPKSTRDLVNEAFGNDPSLPASDTPRTMSQALWMMNNDQLRKQIDAAPASGTMLSRLLDAEHDDRAVCKQLFLRALARRATAEEIKIALAHLAAVGNRRAGFEDILWGLVNSAEFTTRR